MVYSNLFIRKNFQIPTLVSVLAIFLVIIFLTKFFLTTSNPLKATKKNIRRMEITNIFWNQATIFWQTDQRETGWVTFGTDPNKLSQVAFDEKDANPDKKKFSNHYSILRNLKDNTQYYFNLVDSNQLIQRQDGSPFNFKTVSKSSQVSNLQPAYGKVVNQNSLPIENAVVLLSIKNAYLLSTLTKPSGEWLVPLNYIVDTATQSLKTVSNSESVRIEILNEDGISSVVNTYVINVSPLSETITIGKNYNLLENNVLSASTSTSTPGVDIIFPKENAIIPSNSPLIKGTALPNSNVLVRVYDGKKSFSANVKTDKDGIWRLDLSQPLNPGKHILSLEAKNSEGNQITKTRNFTIAKSGEQVLGEATPEATPTTIGPLPTPTIIAATTVVPTSTPKPPVTGGGLYFFTLASLTLVTLGLGVLLIF